MKYAIIENEEFARVNLRQILESIRPDSVCVFEAETVKECISFFSKSPEVDLIFMDIELDDGICFEIFQYMTRDIPVVFTTAYDEYAIRAFKVNSVDYLLKPIGEDDVEVAVARFERRLDSTIDYSKLAMELLRQRHDRILISSANGYDFVWTQDVAWVEAGDKCITLVLKSGAEKITDFVSLAETAKYLNPAEFYQISRGVIASVRSICKVSKYFKGRLSVELRAASKIRKEVVPSARRQDFLDWLGHSS